MHKDFPASATDQRLPGGSELRWSNSTHSGKFAGPENLPEFFLVLGYHDVSAWIWVLILHSISVSQAGWGSTFPTEKTSTELLRSQ